MRFILLRHAFKAKFKIAVTLSLFTAFVLLQACNNDSDQAGEAAFLQAKIIRTGKHFYGAEVSSKTTFLYGKFTAKMRPISKSGTISSFFLYDESKPRGGASLREVDIEFLGKNPHGVSTNLHFHDLSGQYEKFILGRTDLAKNFHEYSIEWHPNFVAWFVDQQLIRHVPAKKAVAQYPMKIFLNAWVSGYAPWAGVVTFSDWDDPHASYEWIKYYAYNPATNSFSTSPTWVENFDTAVNLKWNLSEHTFADWNISIFNPDNILVSEGEGSPLRLDLKITQISNAGE